MFHSQHVALDVKRIRTAVVSTNCGKVSRKRILRRIQSADQSPSEQKECHVPAFLSGALEQAVIGLG
jgi:hypothetical protein